MDEGAASACEPTAGLIQRDMLLAASMAVGYKVACVLGGGIGMLTCIALGLLIARSGGARTSLVDLARPLVHPASAPPGAVIRARGVARPGPRGPEPAPLSGVPSVHYITSAQLRTAIKGVERLSRDWYLDVEGTAVLVPASHPTTLTAIERWWSINSGLVELPGMEVRPLGEREGAWLAARVQGSVRAGIEQRVAVGESVDVVGTIHRTAAGLVFGPADGGAIRLLAASSGPASARSSASKSIGYAIAGLGVAIGVAAAVAFAML